jgi:DNA-binding NarL/FixJ family response regulator
VLALMDVRMPRLDGVTATKRLIGRDGHRALRVIVLTTFDLDEYVFAAIRAGASGFLLKDAQPGGCRAPRRAPRCWCGRRCWPPSRSTRSQRRRSASRGRG